MRFLACLFLPVWMHQGLNVNRFWFENHYYSSLILGSYLSFDTFNAQPSRQFLESWRKMDN
jgi:hypothetical protein